MKVWKSMLWLGLTCLPAYATAEAQMMATGSFSTLEAIVARQGHAQTTLLVMDDDDTLTMMPCPESGDITQCQYLGGPAWSSWQQSLLGTSSPYRVADSEDELFALSSVLFALNFMDYAEPQLPQVLQALTTKGVQLLVETARGNGDISATENQLANLALDSSPAPASLQALIATHGLMMSGMQSSLPSPFMPCATQGVRPVSYRQGVMYVAGQNKGDMLSCLLSHAESQGKITHILFIDDTEQNVQDVYARFKDSPQYVVTAIHYTRLQQHKAALTRGPLSSVYQQQANLRWQSVKNIITTTLLKPTLQ